MSGLSPAYSGCIGRTMFRRCSSVKPCGLLAGLPRLGSFPRRLLYAALLILAMTIPCKAQTITASSCSNTDVQTAFNSVVSTTTLVVIPNCGVGGTTWTSQVTLSVPSGNNSLTIQFAGTCTPSGTPATSGYSISCNDDGEVVDGITGTGGLLSFQNVNNTTLFRVTGLTVSSGRLQYNGMIGISGSSSEVRFDHNHIIFTSDQPGMAMMRVSGCINGVADHNFLVMPSGTGSDNGIQEYNGGTCNGGTKWGNHAWANATNLGGSNFFFLEDNVVQNGFSNDCLFAGRFVIRYNTFNVSAPGAPVQTHATTGGAQRGCRAWEIYDNYVVNQSASQAFEAFRLESGTGVVWNNTVSTANGGYSHILSFHSERSSNVTYGEQPTPNGWGYCGTNFNGTGSEWDQNTLTTDGHECLDNVGMGQGHLIADGSTNVDNNGNSWPGIYDTQATSGTAAVTMDANGSGYTVGDILTVVQTGGSGLQISVTCTSGGCAAGNTGSVKQISVTAKGSGYTTATGLATTGGTGTGATVTVLGYIDWPQQALEPVYEWMDTANTTAGGAWWSVNEPSTTALANNREFYVWCNASSNTGCATFDGTQGVGSGLLSARPSTCTSGVAYWATDSSELYKCTATNTWSAYYTPYTYPHPLDTSGSTSGGSTVNGGTTITGGVKITRYAPKTKTLAELLFGVKWGYSIPEK